MGRYSEEAGTFKITSATFSPLLSHPFPTDDPLIITDNKTAGNQLGVGLSAAGEVLLVFLQLSLNYLR